MRILALKPIADPGGGAMKLVATFDLQLTDTVRLYGLRLLQTPDGRRIVYAAQAGSRRTATFSRELSEAITTAASIELEAATAHDISESAA
ncbi:hypothetical protein [Rhizobium sp. BK456]|uniref:hypothetical protein n=1 Tax=Rhizobium sp. BK456 TaxID=2587007 RepID=UPI00160823FE|nr:hypothetical protein [Rhizobium sp. BK456]MBB3523099.1 hypothetical protein [Rhizobium sp. BK456]